MNYGIHELTVAAGDMGLFVDRNYCWRKLHLDIA